jgi:uncharacterized protein
MGYNYLSKKVETRESGISGLGTFANEFIKKDELITVFGGRILTYNEWAKLPVKLRHMVLQINDELFIGPDNEDDLGDGDYINHSCDPSAGINGHIYLVAIRDIHKGEEITFDYITNVTEKNDFRINCTCGSDQCRKIITGNDWKNVNLQNKYKGYFSYYIQQKIDIQTGR